MDGVALEGMRRLAIKEKRGRAELGMDIKLLETKAVESGFLEDTDDAADVEAEFYVDDEPDEAGTSAEDVKGEMEAATEAETTDGQEPPEEITGTDLF
jgi:hypothetical protein